MFPLCPVVCVLLPGETCTSPLLSQLCALRGVQQVIDFESSFCQAASKKRQRFGYCTCRKCGSLHTHLIFMHSKKPPGTLFHSWIPAVACSRKCKDSSLFLAETWAGYRQKLSGCLLNVQSLSRCRAGSVNHLQVAGCSSFTQHPEHASGPFLCATSDCASRALTEDVLDRNLCMCSLNSKSCQLGWAPCSRTVWSSFYIHLGEIFHYAACQSSPSVISLLSTCAGAQHWKVHFRDCCLSQEHFVNSGNSWINLL